MWPPGSAPLGLHRIAGNPHCGENLQPGFSCQMTWVYHVPVDAQMTAFEFEDITDFSRDRTVPPTRIPLTGTLLEQLQVVNLLETTRLPYKSAYIRSYPGRTEPYSSVR